MLRRYVLLFLGVFACSTSVIQIKASHTPPLVLAAIRLLLAVVFLSPLFWRDLQAHRSAYSRAHVRRTTLPAVVLALHFVSWTYCARLTLAAAAAVNPLVARLHRGPKLPIYSRTLRNSPRLAQA
ncbi:MAG TPA: hypothetical protein VHE13_13235 [Opitutus sp.]|nr:hypothetical protein [Opitutus sp.]